MLHSIDLHELPRGSIAASQELEGCGATFNGDPAPVTLLQEFCSAFGLECQTRTRNNRVSADLGFQGTHSCGQPRGTSRTRTRTARWCERTSSPRTRMRDILRGRGLLPAPLTCWAPASWLQVSHQGYTTSRLYEYQGVYSLNRILVTDPRNIRAFAWDEEGSGHTCDIPVLARRSTFGQLAVILENGSPTDAAVFVDYLDKCQTQTYIYI